MRQAAWLLLAVLLLAGCATPQYAGCSKPVDPKDPSWCQPPGVFDPFPGAPVFRR